MRALRRQKTPPSHHTREEREWRPGGAIGIENRLTTGPNLIGQQFPPLPAVLHKRGREHGRQGEGECTCTTHSGLKGQEREWLAAVCAGVCCCKVAGRPSFTGRTCGANFAAGRRTFPFARSPLGLDQILAVQLCSCEQKRACARQKCTAPSENGMHSDQWVSMGSLKGFRV